MNEVIDLLNYLGATKICQPKGSKIQYTCVIHNESNPSAGINIDFSPPDKPNEHYQTFNCFSCHAHGTIPWLVLKSLPDEFSNIREVNKWLKERYGVEYKYHYDPKTKTIKRYEEFFEDSTQEKRHIIPKSKLAPFKSGKSTYQYFFDRGFDKSDMRDYMIGRDLQNETITIPVFWGDGELAGIIGRYIDPARPKNQRYKIYEFPKGSLLFPLDKVKVVNDTIILVEGQFDAMKVRNWGYPNVLATFTNSVSRQQAEMLKGMCKKIITLFDNDEGGDTARLMIEKELGSDILIAHPTWYPREGKDPSEWGYYNTVSVLASAKWSRAKEIPRMD
jgi:DNA primase